MPETAFSGEALSSDRPSLTVSSSSDTSEQFQQLVNPYAPVLILNPDGFIEHLTDAARRLLQYRSGQAVDAYFFTHVHGKNMRQVMRDLAGMVRHGEEGASWLLRMRTGRDRWRWYRAQAVNETDNEPPAVTVRLRDLYDW